MHQDLNPDLLWMFPAISKFWQVPGIHPFEKKKSPVESDLQNLKRSWGCHHFKVSNVLSLDVSNVLLTLRGVESDRVISEVVPNRCGDTWH